MLAEEIVVPGLVWVGSNNIPIDVRIQAEVIVVPAFVWVSNDDIPSDAGILAEVDT